MLLITPVVASAALIAAFAYEWPDEHSTVWAAYGLAVLDASLLCILEGWSKPTEP